MNKHAGSKTLSLLFAIGVAACASGTPAADPAPTPQPEATEPAPMQSEPAASEASGGHFTAAQADGGRDSFRALCTECHFSGEFNDQQFKFKWSRRSAESLYDLIFTQMPESAPGSLTPEEAVGLVAYILRMNGFEEGGAELVADPAVLGAISLSAIRNEE